MQYIIGFSALLVIGSWATVILHQLGVETFNPARYPIMDTTLAIAYMVAAVSFCGMVGFVVILLLRE